MIASGNAVCQVAVRHFHFDRFLIARHIVRQSERGVSFPFAIQGNENVLSFILNPRGFYYRFVRYGQADVATPVGNVDMGAERP